MPNRFGYTPPMRLTPLSLLVVLVVACPIVATAETVTIATYNIEHFESHFEAHRLRRAVPRAATRPAARPAGAGAPSDGPSLISPADAERAARVGSGFADGPEDVSLPDLLREERYQNDEDNWEVAEVIADPRFNPDVLVIQEGCSQENLE